MKAYYDGSGKTGDPKSRAITLAGVSASEATWPRFEEAWGEALTVIGLRFWHTSEMNYWMTETAFDRAVSRLLDVIGAFREAPLITYAATVILEDYDRAVGSENSGR